MRSLNRKTPILIALFVLFYLFSSHAAMADPPAFPMGDCQDRLQNALYKGAQTKNTAAENVFHGVPQPNFNLVYCMDAVMAIFHVIGLISDPLGVIIEIAWEFIQNEINALCADALQAVNEVIDLGWSFLNKLCIPIPGLNGTFGFDLNLGFGGGACNGIPLIGEVGGAGSNGYAAPGIWTILGIQQE